MTSVLRKDGMTDTPDLTKKRAVSGVSSVRCSSAAGRSRPYFTASDAVRSVPAEPPGNAGSEWWTISQPTAQRRPLSRLALVALAPQCSGYLHEGFGGNRP